MAVQSLYICNMVLLGAVALFSDFNLFTYVVDNPWKTVLGIVAYFVLIRVIVGGSKRNGWDEEQLKKGKDNIAELSDRIESLKDAINAGPAMTEAIWPDWKDYEKDYTWRDVYGRRRGITRPLAKHNKARIASWIAWWPAVGSWTLLHDPNQENWAMALQSLCEAPRAPVATRMEERRRVPRSSEAESMSKRGTLPPLGAEFCPWGNNMKTYAIAGTIEIPNNVSIHDVLSAMGKSTPKGVDVDLDQVDLIDEDEEDEDD